MNFHRYVKNRNFRRINPAPPPPLPPINTAFNKYCTGNPDNRGVEKIIFTLIRRLPYNIIPYRLSRGFYFKKRLTTHLWNEKNHNKQLVNTTRNGNITFHRNSSLSSTEKSTVTGGVTRVPSKHTGFLSFPAPTT